MGILLELRVSGRIEHAITLQSDQATKDSLARIEGKLSTLEEGVFKMSKEVDDLKTAVEAENTVVDSAIKLLQDLSAAIAAAKDDPAAIQALASEIANKSADLAAAVAANTPAAPPVPTPVGDPGQTPPAP